MKKFSVIFCALALLAFSFAVCAPQAAAQAVFGSIFGTVLDPSGAAVPGAKVTVTSATKGTTGGDDEQRRRKLQRHPPYPRYVQRES